MCLFQLLDNEKNPKQIYSKMIYDMLLDDMFIFFCPSYDTLDARCISDAGGTLFEKLSRKSSLG